MARAAKVLNKTKTFLENIVKAGAEGYSREDARKDTGSSESGIYSIAHGLRKRGHMLQFRDGKYIYQGHGSQPTNPRTAALATPSEPPAPANGSLSYAPLNAKGGGACITLNTD